MPCESLYKTIFQSPESLRRLNGVSFDNFSPLRRLLSYIYYLPFEWRKLLLNACRVQRPILSNDYLHSEFTAIQGEIAYASVGYLKRGGRRFGYKPVSLMQIVDEFQNIYDNPMLCCLLSYFVRAEGTCNGYLQSFKDLKQLSTWKEIGASQQVDIDQQLDYRCLFTDENLVGVHHEVGNFPHRMVYLFKTHLAKMKNSLSSTLLLPYYNVRKNIGYKTQTALVTAQNGGIPPESQPKNYTTMSLLNHYRKTGEKILGPLEMRQSWSFGDLKPRTYYCLGGTAYWSGLYIKDIANAMVDAFPSTNPFSRFDIQRIGVVSDEEIFITYDYSSFTTSLAELKYFMWYLSTAFDDVDASVLDVHTGLERMNLGELLRDYNEAVNSHQEFDISRVVKLFQEDGYDTLFQLRSGSLGVQGNITFSTLLHGISLSGFTNTPDQDSCVGDDAAFKLHFLLLVLFGVIANKLGLINPDKVTKIPRPRFEDTQAVVRESFKYIKRPVSVNWEGGVDLGVLDFFPNLAVLLFPDGDGIHTVFGKDKPLESFCMQWGRFLNVMQRTAYSQTVVESDISLIISVVQAVYDMYRLPVFGALPGSVLYSDEPHMLRHKGPGERMKRNTFFIPPCDDIDCFDNPWMETLLNRFDGAEFVFPRKVRDKIPMPETVYEGCEFLATSAPILRLMEGFFMLRSEIVTDLLTFDERFVRNYQVPEDGSLTEMESNIVRNYVVIEVPFWYSDVYEQLYPEFDIGYSHEEATVEILSMLGSDST